MIATRADPAVERFQQATAAIEREMSAVIVGQRDVIRSVLIALLARGHVLLEGVPGMGKTRLVRTLAGCISLRYSRIQFTPDLMPADITGTNIISEDESGDRRFRFEPGPIFANLVLADEINRATPKTQSALLEAMQEQQVTVSTQVHRLASPFMVLATQNPIEMEGTYPLPEAQLDRFLFKVIVTAPEVDELVTILERTTSEREPQERRVTSSDELLPLQELVREVPVAQHVLHYVARLAQATDPEHADSPRITREYVRYGSSPRGAQALVLAGKVNALLNGRYNVAFEDVRGVAHASLRHRIILNFEAEAEGITSDEIINQLVIAITPDEFAP